MMPSSHNVVALTGAIAAGKSTLSAELVDAAMRRGLVAEIVRPARLYERYLDSRAANPPSRGDMSDAVKRARHELGSAAGTTLLRRYLSRRPTDGRMYIVDGKRTLAGLTELREAFPGALCIGVWAPTSDRRKRFETRQAEKDQWLDFDRADLMEAEQFDVDECLALSDEIYENDLEELPLRRRLFADSIVGKMLGNLPEPTSPLQPTAKALPVAGDSVRPLSRKELRRGLADLAAECRADGALCVVIQGGNEYISASLRQAGVDVVDVKLSSLMKQSLGVLLATSLTASERIAPFQGRSFGEALQDVRHLPDGVFESGSAVGEWARLEAHIRSAPHPRSDLDSETEVRLAQSSIARRLRGARRIVFVDDILFRGRTLHAAHALLSCFGASAKPWSFIAMCPDRSDPPPITAASRARTLFDERAYSFENCAIASDGYWDFVGSRFEYRALADLRDSSMLLEGDSWASQAASSEFLRLSKLQAQSLQAGADLGEIAVAAVRLVAHQRSVLGNWEPDVVGLADQRAVNMGWAPFYIKFWQAFIPQVRPLRQRELFKQGVVNLVRTVSDSTDVLMSDLIDLADEGGATLMRRALNVTDEP
jgi:hypothetical protein